MSGKKWRLLGRKQVFASDYINVYRDKIEVPSGKVFSVYAYKESDYVIIVATDSRKRVLAIKEYRNAAGRFIIAIPGGDVGRNESLTNAAKRELLEETGYTGMRFECIGKILDNPGSCLDTGYVFRVKNVRKERTPSTEEKETIVEVKFFTPGALRALVDSGGIQASPTIAALAVAGIL